MKNPRVMPSPERFRAQCTGIGQTRAASEQTGMRRSQCVIDCAPKEQLKFRAAAGYPAPYEEGCYGMIVGAPVQRSSLK